MSISAALILATNPKHITFKLTRTDMHGCLADTLHADRGRFSGPGVHEV